MDSIDNQIVWVLGNLEFARTASQMEFDFAMWSLASYLWDKQQFEKHKTSMKEAYEHLWEGWV